jgi:hypothetical protein
MVMNCVLRREGRLQRALVVQRHRLHLPEGVLAVEHPAVGAGEQGVGHVAQAGVERGAGPRRRPGALNPLPLEVGGDLAAFELPGPDLRDRQARARHLGVGREEVDAAAVPDAGGAALDALAHEAAALGVERRERVDHGEGARRQDVRIRLGDARAQHDAPTRCVALGSGFQIGHRSLSSGSRRSYAADAVRQVGGMTQDKPTARRAARGGRATRA